MLSIELALRKKADIFLLDEPTAALSERLVRTTLDRLTQIAKEERTGVILVEQNVEEARRISDTEVYLQLGKDMAKQ